MGIWDKDKELGRRLDSVFSLGDYLIVYGMEAAGTVSTDIGEARKTALTVATLDNPSDRMEVNTLSKPIADRVELMEDGDFPVVVQLLKVQPKNKAHNPAVVLQYVRDYDGNEAAAPAASDTRQQTADESIPF